MKSKKPNFFWEALLGISVTLCFASNSMADQWVEVEANTRGTVRVQLSDAEASEARRSGVIHIREGVSYRVKRSGTDSTPGAAKVPQQQGLPHAAPNRAQYSRPGESHSEKHFIFQDNPALDNRAPNRYFKGGPGYQGGGGANRPLSGTEMYLLRNPDALNPRRDPYYQPRSGATSYELDALDFNRKQEEVWIQEMARDGIPQDAIKDLVEQDRRSGGKLKYRIPR